MAELTKKTLKGLGRAWVCIGWALCLWGAEASAQSGSEAESAADVEVEEVAPPMGTLLDRALEGRAPLKLGKAKPKAKALPQVPTAGELIAALSVVGPAVRGCVKRHVGDQAVAVELNLVLSGAKGALSATVLVPPFAGTAAGRCVEAVVRRAKYPRFAQTRLVVRVPFLLEPGLIEPAFRSPKTP